MLALEGVKILDLTRAGPGPFCTMILGDLGAEVVKIEAPPTVGERQAGSFHSPMGEEGRRQAAYQCTHRNKKSVALNLRVEAGRRIFHQLAKAADVIVEGFRPGVVKRLGIDYAVISSLNPRIIYCSITGYGQDGPYRDLPGHDINYLALTGVLGILNEGGGGPPIVSGVKLADVGGGSLQAAIGILLAILAREKTGRGQYVDIAMADGIMSWLLLPSALYFESGRLPQPGVVALDGKRPGFYSYKTKDGGYISLGLREPRLFANLCQAIGREDLIPEQNAPSPRREEIIAELQEIFLTRTRDEWFQFLRENDVSVSPVYTLDEAFSDPHFLHRKMMVELEHPTEGKVKQLGIAIKLSDTPGRIERFAPAVGENTEEILLDLGYSAGDRAGLRSAGAIN